MPDGIEKSSCLIWLKGIQALQSIDVIFVINNPVSLKPSALSKHQLKNLSCIPSIPTISAAIQTYEASLGQTSNNSELLMDNNLWLC